MCEDSDFQLLTKSSRRMYEESALGFIIFYLREFTPCVDGTMVE